MAPVTFCRDRHRPIRPYYISPWQNEKMSTMPAVMVPLRGDFFCLPFGINAESFRGEQHPPHGETAGSCWTLDRSDRELDLLTLAIRLESNIRPGVIRREFVLRDGHNTVYCRTVIDGYRGPTPFAHHAVLAMPARERTLRIFTSPFAIGRTYPVPSANPGIGEYQSLATDALFQSLAKVPSIFEGAEPEDCSSFPARPGYCDLIQQFEIPTGDRLSWVVAINIEERWMWYAIKSPAQMPGRLFWIENRGRHASPWNGRNSCLGIEDGCMYFDRGIAESCRENPVNRQGIPTSVGLDGNYPYEVRYIQGSAHLPEGFTSVDDVEFLPGTAVFHSHSSESVRIDLWHEFLRT